jgi:trans-2,3-dihydro-3-hydroxyanthranilate isomerase
MPRNVAYRLVDVFTDRPLAGNALAVFPDGRGLDTAMMQAVARELNLPETTFVLPPSSPDATYHIRTFTPVRECVFAGHAFHGTAYALTNDGLLSLFEPLTTVWQETRLGVTPLEIEVEGGRPTRVSLALDAPVFGRVFGRPGSPVLSAMALALGVEPEVMTARGLFPQVVQTGTVSHLVACFDDLAVLSAAVPDAAALLRIARQLEVDGFAAFAMKAMDPRARFHLRYFSPRTGAAEEAATASGAAALGAFLAHRRLVVPDHVGPTRFAIEQGVELHRPGLIEVAVGVDRLDLEAYTVRVTGKCVTVASGELYLP